MSYFTCKQKGKTLTCKFLPKMDTLTTDEIKEEVMKFTHKPNLNKIVFDLKNVNYICSSFLNLAQKVAKESSDKNKEFKIENTSYKVKEVFKIAGFDKFIHVD